MIVCVCVPGGGGGGVLGNILVGVCPGIPKNMKKQGLRCGHNQKKGRRCGYNPKKGELELVL